MKKFIANYLVSETGLFLKNGILVATEDGTAVEYIDTTGDLKELAGLIFQNGIVMAGFAFVRTTGSTPVSEPNETIQSFVYQRTTELNQLSLQDMIGLGKQMQNQFPEMNIPDIWQAITAVLLTNLGFMKQEVSGIFLLNGADLVRLQFTPKSKLKRIV